MRVRFWGTRGSIAAPGPSTVRYGGNTSCVALTPAAGELLILDCGTGARALGAWLCAHVPAPMHAAILLTHTHWDHIQGFPFFAPAFLPGNHFDIYAPEGGLRSLQETLAGQMEYTYFPVALSQLPSTITCHEFAEGVRRIGSARVASIYLNHPAMTLGYRIECDGLTIAYLTDHEPFSTLGTVPHVGDRRHARFMAGADLVIHDAQYTPEQMAARRNWGHSSFDYVVNLAAAAGVHRVVLTHHDPAHGDDDIARIETRARAMAHERSPAMEVACAREGQEWDLGSRPAGPLQELPELHEQAVEKRTFQVRFVGRDVEIAKQVREALDCEPLSLRQDGPPDIVVLDLDSAGPVWDPGIPLLVLTYRDLGAMRRSGFDPASIDYLVKPFSVPQLRARVRARLGRRDFAVAMHDTAKRHPA